MDEPNDLPLQELGTYTRATQHYQKRVADWVIEVFGAEFQNSRTERVARLLEEAIETAQSGGLTKFQCHNLVDQVFEKEPDPDITKEMAGTLQCLLALAAHTGVNLHNILLTQLKDIERPERKAEIRAKRTRKRVGDPALDAKRLEEPLPDA